MEYSKYQLEIFKELKIGTGNLVIGATAGSGKSFVILEALRRIPIHKKTISIAFNKAIVEELKKKVPTRVDVATLHSFGLRMCYRHYGKVLMSESKQFKFIKPVIEKARKELQATEYESLKDKDQAIKDFDKKKGRYMYVMIQLMSLFRMNLYVNLDDLKIVNTHYGLDASDDLIKWTADAIGLMRKYNRVCTDKTMVVDFADMIYLPATVEMDIEQYDYVFIDECQDLNMAQQAILTKMLKKKSRFIAVGDPQQAIYGFAGSDIESFNRLIQFPNTKQLPLSVCYRCGTEIVKHAQRINPIIQPFDQNIPGQVRLNGNIDEIEEGDFVLCRNTAPLIELYFKLLFNGQKAFVKGRDIGENLIVILEPYMMYDSVDTREYLDNELKKLKEELKAKGINKPEFNDKYIALREKVDVLQIFLYKFNTTSQASRHIKEIFKEEGSGIVLSTIHKSKGLETDRVHIIRYDLIPSQYATQEWQKEQERNLEYVMVTRAKKELIYIPNLNWADMDKIEEWNELDCLTKEKM